MKLLSHFAVAFCLLASACLGQANERPGTDLGLASLDTILSLGHEGPFPGGKAAFAMQTTVCNIGTVAVPWLAPMASDHPIFSFLIARETDDRMVQVSNYSYAKHGIGASNTSLCGPCINPPTDSMSLAVGCSDTYSIHTNANNSLLAPADEVDPWLGTWDPVCSYFDRGNPPVGAPLDCDGIASPVAVQGVVGNRMSARDSDLFVADATFYFQTHVVVRGEPETNRGDNLGSRIFTPVWNGANWLTSVQDETLNPLVHGSVLERWRGASVTSATNGSDDGRVYVAVKTKSLGGGMVRYEYAVHNRDNGRGISSIRIPVAPNASVTNVNFRDLDTDAANDWSFSRNLAEIAFSTATNPVRWNSIYNFWFDSNAAPLADQTVAPGQHDAGAGLDAFTLNSKAPMGAALGQDLGFGTTGSNGLAPEFVACGALGTGQRGHFLVRFGQPNATVFLFAGSTNNPTPVWGGTLVPIPIAFAAAFKLDGEGTTGFTLAGGGGPATAYVQFVLIDPGSSVGHTFSNAALIPVDP